MSSLTQSTSTIPHWEKFYQVFGPVHHIGLFDIYNSRDQRGPNPRLRGLQLNQEQ